MPDHSHLPWLIHEELFRVNEKEGSFLANPVEKNVPPVPESLPHHPLIVTSAELMPAEKELLRKILKAVNVDEADFTHYIDKTGACTYTRHLIFGEDLAKKNAITTPVYQLLEGPDTSSVLVSRTLSHLLTSVEDKTALWNILKKWFEIN
ncbi:MAG: hypothetical protein OEY56_07270 [Cyclobacteriaceae bacterium]|nr:hypothetical protein [Cyclobacteriaceae bacterium]